MTLYLHSQINAGAAAYFAPNNIPLIIENSVYEHPFGCDRNTLLNNFKPGLIVACAIAA